MNAPASTARTPSHGRCRQLLCLALLGVALAAGGCASGGSAAQQERDVKRASSLLALGADHLQNGRPGMALRDFLRAAELDPRNPRIQYGLGEAYWARDRLEDAEKHLRRALELFEQHHDSRMTLSALLIRQGRYEEAIAESQILLDDPTFTTPWHALANRGWSELQLSRLAEARRSLDRALEFSPAFWPAMLSKAILETQAGRPLEAVGLFQELLSVGPGPAAESEVNYRLAEVYISLGKHARAVSHLTASVARQPEGPWARKSEAYLKLLR